VPSNSEERTNKITSTYICGAVSEVVRPIEIGTLIYWLEMLDFTKIFLPLLLDVGSELIGTDLYQIHW